MFELFRGLLLVLFIPLGQISRLKLLSWGRDESLGPSLCHPRLVRTQCN